MPLILKKNYGLNSALEWMERVRYDRVLLEDLIHLYEDTVLHICSKTYTAEDIEAWLSVPMDKELWHKKFTENHAWILQDRDRIVAFGLMSSEGYLDLLYTHHLYQCQGLSSQILEGLEQEVAVEQYTLVSTENAITFYEKKGYRLWKIAYKKYHSRYFYYYYMSKSKNK